MKTAPKLLIEGMFIHIFSCARLISIERELLSEEIGVAQLNI